MERKKKEEKAFKEKVVIEFYKRNPEIFLERELGIKLSWLQKKLLHLFFVASTTVSGDGIYAEYTYNGDKQELYEDVYGKISNTRHTEE